MARWFQGTTAPYNAGTGAAARKDNGGFTVYFSDRRNNRNALSQETSEYGTYKCCTTVYGPPTRNYAFDVDFLTPALLPPNTPVFRDMNAVGFSQELRPGR
jgi:hypothetical protein